MSSDQVLAGQAPADESPSTEIHRFGPSSTPTHPLALVPAVAPPATVDGFVKEFLRELNTEPLDGGFLVGDKERKLLVFQLHFCTALVIFIHLVGKEEHPVAWYESLA